jgi:hypothetical protein
MVDGKFPIDIRCSAFDIRLFDIRLFDIRLFDIRLFGIRRSIFLSPVPE